MRYSLKRVTRVDIMKCSNCNKNISGVVYYIEGYTHRCCSVACLAYLRMNVSVLPVEEMTRRDREERLNILM